MNTPFSGTNFYSPPKKVKKMQQEKQKELNKKEKEDKQENQRLSTSELLDNEQQLKEDQKL